MLFHRCILHSRILSVGWEGKPGWHHIYLIFDYLSFFSLCIYYLKIYFSWIQNGFWCVHNGFWCMSLQPLPPLAFPLFYKWSMPGSLKYWINSVYFMCIHGFLPRGGSKGPCLRFHIIIKREEKVNALTGNTMKANLDTKF